MPPAVQNPGGWTVPIRPPTAHGREIRVSKEQIESDALKRPHIHSTLHSPHLANEARSYSPIWGLRPLMHRAIIAAGATSRAQETSWAKPIASGWGEPCPTNQQRPALVALPPTKTRHCLRVTRRFRNRRYRGDRLPSSLCLRRGIARPGEPGDFATSACTRRSC